MKVFMLTAHDSASGTASRPVGFLAYHATASHIEWVPNVNRDAWERAWSQCAEMAGKRHPGVKALDEMISNANGVTWGAVELTEGFDSKEQPHNIAATLLDEELVDGVA